MTELPAVSGIQYTDIRLESKLPSSFSESLKSVNDLATLIEHSSWLIFVSYPLENYVFIEDISQLNEISDDMKVFMNWPCLKKWATMPLGSIKELKSMTNQSNCSLFDLSRAKQQQMKLLNLPPPRESLALPVAPKYHLSEAELEPQSAITNAVDGEGEFPMTECLSSVRRRLEEGGGGAVVLLDGRVVQGAFNWRAMRGVKGEKLRCFDYFPSRVIVRPQELPVAPVASANDRESFVRESSVRESFVPQPHSDRLIREVTAEVVMAGAFLTVGLVIRLLWRRMKSPSGTNSDAQRTCRTSQTKKGTDLDGESITIPKPGFYTRLGRKLSTWFTGLKN
eukprot:GHVT01060031.1.p1 GENE.GHVT01060031.1~~GHVT01060031.1.p1  ORF type:complete len:338 (+),score=33.08 GHVT01060031.1:1141-2154(+)